MRILFLSQRVPYPPNRGDKILNYNYIRHLARSHDIVVACLADGHSDLQNIDGLAPLVNGVEAVPVSRHRGRLRALTALAAGNRPLTVAYFDEAELHRRVKSLVETTRFDMALVCSSGMAQYVEAFPRLTRVIQFTDLDSQKWQLLAASSRFPKSRVYRTEADRLLRYERRIAEMFDASLFCSSRELEDFRRLIPGIPADYVRNGVDLEHFQPAHETQIPNNLVFTGVMDYAPNIDGVIWFCREILPRIQESVSGATLTICGGNPAKAVQKLANLAGVHVTGAVRDVRPYLARASVAVVPVRIARGIQNKLLEAMAMGLPAVTTTAAYGGLEAEIGSELFVADQAVEFANTVVRLLRDHPLRVRTGQLARAAVVNNYQWSRSLAKLDDVIAAATSDRTVANETAVEVASA